MTRLLSLLIITLMLFSCNNNPSNSKKKIEEEVNFEELLTRNMIKREYKTMYDLDRNWKYFHGWHGDCRWDIVLVTDLSNNFKYGGIQLIDNDKLVGYIGYSEISGCIDAIKFMKESHGTFDDSRSFLDYETKGKLTFTFFKKWGDYRIHVENKYSDYCVVFDCKKKSDIDTIVKFFEDSKRYIEERIYEISPLTK